MADLVPEGTKVQVSATAPGTSRRSLLQDDDAPWTAPASPASVCLRFPEPVRAARLALTFQGGFVARAVAVSVTVSAAPDEAATPDTPPSAADVARAPGEPRAVGIVYPEDVNRRQVFDIPYAAGGGVPAINALTLELRSSSDHHGRVTLYRVELLP